MQLPRFINRTLFLVRINRAEQKKRRETINGIHLHVNHTFMQRNMQYGEIVMIGHAAFPAPMRYDENGHELGLDYSAQEAIPQARVGDELLFHHSIEGSLDDRNGDERQRWENRKHLLLQNEEFNYYVVHYRQAYACVKADGSVFTTPDWILAEPLVHEKKENADEHGRVLVERNGLVLFENFEPTQDETLQHLKQLENETAWLSKTGVTESATASKEANERRAEAARGIQEKMKEMEAITRNMSKGRILSFRYLHGSPVFNESCGVTLDSNYIIGYKAVGPKAPEIEYREKIYSLIKTSQVLNLQRLN